MARSAAARQTDGLAIGSLVCGIIAMLFWGIIFGPAAIVLGYLAHGKRPSGMAKAGMILGAIAFILSLVGLLMLDGNGMFIVS